METSPKLSSAFIYLCTCNAQTEVQTVLEMGAVIGFAVHLWMQIQMLFNIANAMVKGFFLSFKVLFQDTQASVLLRLRKA